MTRDEIVEAIRQTDERVRRLAPLAAARPEAPLPTGEWRVRDALSHLAARGNPVALVMARLRDFEATNQPTVRDIHEVNAGQVRDRSALSIAELIEEMIEGHRVAIDALASLDEETAQRQLSVAFRPEPLSVAEYIYLAGPRHDNNHLDEIEQALN
jgi:hypothetical protein